MEQFFRRILRRFRQWIDPLFDGDVYAEMNIVTLDDGRDYHEEARHVIGENVYCLMYDEDKPDDFCFRKLIFENRTELLVGLDDEEEFNVVLKRFAQDKDARQEIKMAAAWLYATSKGNNTMESKT